ncbi:hypothetical protein PLICRDRAFT_581787 [Plicaturopsis crispa FD-325 SS-3]|nr:hypothetical protein PLICRDRAFT_581787 [Plicaturopsis crispa FD-325 SS-3]
MLPNCDIIGIFPCQNAPKSAQMAKPQRTYRSIHIPIIWRFSHHSWRSLLSTDFATVLLPACSPYRFELFSAFCLIILAYLVEGGTAQLQTEVSVQDYDSEIQR